MTNSYVHRAATLALVWSELLDDMAPAEDCTGLAELTARRDQLRRDLRLFLERTDAASGADKWVQRAFWAAPPKRQVLDDRWKESLLAWVASMDLTAEATHDVVLAVRSLFSDGAPAAAELAKRRPGLAAAVQQGLGASSVEDDEICRVSATHVLEDCYLPMYLTDRALARIVWSNRSFQALLGMAADEVVRVGFQGVLARLGAMVSPDEVSTFVQRQEEVLVAGRVLGRGFISGVVDLDRRTWTHGLPTPPWTGVLRLDAFAHFVLDRKTNARIGSMVVLHARPA